MQTSPGHGAAFFTYLIISPCETYEVIHQGRRISIVNQTSSQRPHKLRTRLSALFLTVFLLSVLLALSHVPFAFASKAAALLPNLTPIPAAKVSITSPLNGATFSSPATIVITASVNWLDNIPGRVEFDNYSANTVLDTIAAPGPYTFTWTNVPAGTYTLAAGAIPGGGNSAEGVSAPITITVLPAQTTPCRVIYQLESQWSTGFLVNIVVTNLSSTPITGWHLAFTFPNEQLITQLWNGTFTQGGEQVTITNASWNGAIAPNGTITSGFIGYWTSSNSNPTLFTLNGTPCR